MALNMKMMLKNNKKVGGMESLLFLAYTFIEKS